MLPTIFIFYQLNKNTLYALIDQIALMYSDICEQDFLNIDTIAFRAK